ncbi:Thymocyte nuclear protein 1 [Nowakowskiella sp. JEL0407]|nr:Thymocyte nuclear protein 1 [Nowakowskiella sp. JEL0407]
MSRKRKQPTKEPVESVNEITESVAQETTDDNVNPPAPTLKYWLLKSEPESRIENGIDMKFGIDDFEAENVTNWEGVRNYAARNILRDGMSIGDTILFYHSNCKTPGIAGIGKIVSEALPDESQFNVSSPYFDPKSTRKNVRWFMRKVEFVRRLDRFIPLKELKTYVNAELSSMVLLKRGRLSVQPVSTSEYEFILQLEKNM